MIVLNAAFGEIFEELANLRSLKNGQMAPVGSRDEWGQTAGAVAT